MRKLLIFLMITAMLFTLAACKAHTANEPAGNTEAAQTEHTPEPVTEDPVTQAPEESQKKPEEDYLKIFSDGNAVELYSCFIYGKSYVEPSDTNPKGGMLHADGIAFFMYPDIKEGIEEGLPEVPRGFETELGEDCRITQINVYDPDTIDRLASVKSADELISFIEGVSKDLIVEIQVMHEGKFIEALNEHEEDAYCFGFIISANGE